MGELFIMAPLHTSHDLAPRSDPHRLAESQPKFVLDVIVDEITPKLNRKTRRVGPSLDRAKVNTRSELRSFHDVLSTYPHGGYEDRLVLVGKLVDATSELL